MLIFPILTEARRAESLADCMDMARDALSLWAVTEMEAGREVPPPSELSSIDVPAGAVAILVDVDFEEYRKKLANRAVRKNCTIPSWLNEAAEKQGVNFSAVLQRALMEQLGVKS